MLPYMKQPAKIDVAVLILFFNRPDSLKKVFDEVRRARPRGCSFTKTARGESAT